MNKDKNREGDYERLETDKQIESVHNRKACMAVIGGILIQMYNGSFFLWPTISIYVISYLQKFNEEINENAHFRVYLVLVLTNCIGFQIGPYLANIRRWNPKLILTLGSSIAITGVFISSYVQNFWLFVLFYGAMSGLGCGMGYIVPLICCWDYFPKSKGLMAGIIAGSYGLGSLVYTQVATKIVNPLSLSPQKDIGVADYKLFEEDVTVNVPRMLRSLVFIYAIQCFIGICLISRPKDEKSVESKKTEKAGSKRILTQSSKYDPKTKQILREFDLVSLTACLHSVRFWQYFSFFILSDQFCVLFIGQYKSLALAHGYSDHVLSIAASLSAFSQTAGRFISSTLYDWYGVKPVFLTMMTVNFIAAICAYDMLSYPRVYMILVQVNFYLLGGIFSIFPTPISKSFGPKYGA